MPSRRIHYLAACTSLIALIFLCLAWELKLAPIQAGGSWLVLKCLPLLAPLPGILNGRKYTYQWSSMLIVFYFTEGVVRTIESTQPERLLAITETLLALIFFWSTICFIRQRDDVNGGRTRR